MTRALGDSVMSPAGILPTPQVTSFDYARCFATASTTAATTTSTDAMTPPTTPVHTDKQKVRVLIATDGILDVMSNEEAADILCKYLEEGGNNQCDNQDDEDDGSYPSSLLEEACLHLVMQARQRWQNDLLLDVRVDDATVVVLEFEVS